MAQRVKVATFDAVGGPSKLQKARDGYFAGPTDAGIYRMSHLEPNDIDEMIKKGCFNAGNMVVVHAYKARRSSPGRTL